MYTAWNTAIRILFNVPRDTHRYLIESISQYLHVKTLLASRCVSLYETIEAISKLCFRFLSNLFSIANDYFVNLSDLSIIKYFGPYMESFGFTRTFKYKNE